MSTIDRFSDFALGGGGGLPKIYGGAKNLGGKVERQGA